VSAPAKTPTPVAGAAATPTNSAVSPTSTKTLSDIARERKLGKKGIVGGTLSVAGAPVQRSAGAAFLPNADKGAAEAQRQMERAIRNGTWTERNIRYHEGYKQQARGEWDDAAEKCRKTPGCIPVYRDGAEVDGVKPLRTGDEVSRDLKKKLGASVDVPEPRPR
jgi:hypothetical protein